MLVKKKKTLIDTLFGHKVNKSQIYYSDIEQANVGLLQRISISLALYFITYTCQFDNVVMK